MSAAKFLRRPSHEEVRDMYEVQRLSLRQIEKLTGATSPTIRKWMVEAGVKARSIAEAKAGQKPAPQTIVASVATRRKHRLPGRDRVGYKLDSGGYVHIWVRGKGYVKEHRLVMERLLGRPLLPEEDVHHRNKVRHDNRPENLQLMANRAEHLREHSKERERNDDGTWG